MLSGLAQPPITPSLTARGFAFGVAVRSDFDTPKKSFNQYLTLLIYAVRLSLKPTSERIGKMDKVTFKKVQGSLTAVAMVTGFLAVFLAGDFYNLLMANDLTPFGVAVMPWIIGGLFAVSALVVLAKLLAYSRR